MENSEIYLDSFIFYNWFGLFADHCVDASEDFYHTANTSRLHNKTLTPNKVEKGDVIFVKTVIEFLQAFHDLQYTDTSSGNVNDIFWTDSNFPYWRKLIN